MRFGVGKWIVTLVSLVLAVVAILTHAGVTVPYASAAIAKVNGAFWMLTIGYILLFFANFIGRRL
jgi:hypothetical protein